MAAIVHQLLLVADCAALLLAGDRVAAATTDRLLERAIAAFVLATAGAVVQALALGLAGLGSDPVALTVAAAATAGAALALVPRPSASTVELLQSAWAGLDRRGRAVAGGLFAPALLLLAWPLRDPIIGFDGAVYHLPEIAMWVANGRPGSLVDVSLLFPFANYPVTNEVALTWASGISRSLVPVVLWPQVLFLVTAAAAWRVLTALGARGLRAALAVAALLATPVLVEQLATPSTDLAGLCWVACAAALALGASERPRLAGPALVAIGLALGSKTTTAPVLAAVLGLLVWQLRGRRVPPGVLVGGLAGAALVAAVWPLRNLVLHGSPLWPFRAGFGADPVPHVWQLIAPSLLSRPSATLTGRVGGYADVLAGGLIIAAAGSLAFLLGRRRTLVIASAVALAAVVVWAAAPSTGEPDTPVFAQNPLSATRYALPALAAAAVAVGLAAAAPGRLALLATGLLVVALAWSAVEAWRRGVPFLPPVWAVALAAAAGALAGARATLRIRPLAAIGAVVAVLGSAAASDALAARQAALVPDLPGTAVTAWAKRQPGFSRGQAIAFTGTVFGQLAGDRLQHRLVLVPASEPCARVRSRAAKGLVVAADEQTFARLGVPTAAGCLKGLPPVFTAGDVTAYGGLEER